MVYSDAMEWQRQAERTITMIPGRILKATRIMSGGSGPHIKKLAIRDTTTAIGPIMVSAWFPSMKEIQNMLSGAPIYLAISGKEHPAVALTVGPLPDEEKVEVK